MKNRDRVKVATGGHSAGIVVPYNRKTEVKGGFGQTTVQYWPDNVCLGRAV